MNLLLIVATLIVAHEAGLMAARLMSYWQRRRKGRDYWVAVYNQALDYLRVFGDSDPVTRDGVEHLADIAESMLGRKMEITVTAKV